jgi:tRNA pseudouridine38-40 synthase
MKDHSPTRRWKCVCAYDGGGFAGWQSQRGGRAVQDAIEARLAAVAGRPVRAHGSGRTDAGVHALGQVFHFDAPWRHGPQRLAAALRMGLPPSIQIKSVRPAAADFHARFSAVGKTYFYDLFLGDPAPFARPYCWAVRRPLDLRAMEAAAAVLRGRHDFTAFSAGRGAGEGGRVRNLRRLTLSRRGRRLRITVEGDGFLYKMVRRIVGALVAVGEGKLTPGQLREILGARRRTAPIETAPPQGLFLQRVAYGRKGRP